VLGVSQFDLAQIAVLGGVALVVLLVKRRDLTLFAFDPAHAHAIGISPRLLSATLLGVLALTAVVSLQIVGVVLVVALLIIPGATAHLLTDRISRMLLIAPIIAASCSLTGVYASFYLDIAPGGAVVLVNAIVFAAVYLFSPRHGVIGRAVTRRSLALAGQKEPAG